MDKRKATDAGNTERRNAVTAKGAKGMQRKEPLRMRPYVNRKSADG
jgi:hypothetical protein